jgi:hypothetical protein
MICLRLPESPGIEPLKKAPLLLRFLLTSAAILAMMTVLGTIKAQLEKVDCSGGQESGWDLRTMWH